ncbi:BREX system P-loop protein BrxC [Synechocystis salina LEGE 00031]|uniref:BREX system P-loop protein BrxC n=1 Tax=Synechocystis salina LEGE 00031 TaxID=1828736 RepID=A0ABR9VR76_9SYNC|nr:BREX system P-loop protein BrxC [Synechocystis salina]MBE9253858.1 BREX system P-loop protein BrxC [Synechocystis salina LEGE 00031]
MTQITELLTLKIDEDIKNVIDLEDRSELEIQQEIESYIVTEGIGRHLYNFTNQFTSNIKETGVWISGFYGSGKSYFGKMLGYILDNPLINGTLARERFIPRIKGIADASLIENSIRNLAMVDCRVIFLDIAKQNTDNGLAWTLFANLLKSLGFREDVYGYMEFDLYVDRQYNRTKEIVKNQLGQDWETVKRSNRQVAKLMRQIFLAMDYSETNYTETYNTYNAAIANFSASKFKEELEKYLTFNPDERLVFIFDEASEAISQHKFSLLDLEGISEALSSISNRVWTIAIAQEKLDTVINNANVNRSQLTKVTDRFKTKIHLESTEVDVIIRNRLLQKTEVGEQILRNYYQQKQGLITDITNLNSTFPTKTTNVEEFATYYPFHRYQFDILQKFLFSSNALVATQIAARGMIITTFDVLRKQMRDTTVFNVTPGYAICSEAQTAPPIDLANKYDTARKILIEQNSEIEGNKLLKTLHLLADSDVVAPTIENITKSYITDISKYYDIKPKIEEALNLLLDAKVLLFSNNNWKITSDLEGKILEEMQNFTDDLTLKKREIINYLKDYKLFTSIAQFNDGEDSFRFSVLSDQEDELVSSGNKQLRIIVYSLFNINDNRLDFVEQKKLETQYQKELATLIPDNREFAQISKLIGEILRYGFIEDKYKSDPDPNKRKIMQNFGIIREEKERVLRNKLEGAYRNASLIYLYDELLLNDNTFKSTIGEIQKQIVKNIYTKRLASQLNDALAVKIFTTRNDGLSRLFSGEDFKFFDSHGNFIGDRLKVVEEVTAPLKGRYVDGKGLETELSGPPWGFSFGTLICTLAALFRAGRLTVKYAGGTYYSPDEKAVQEAFKNTTKFKSASFKAVTATLTAVQKQQAVELLLDLDVEKHTGRKVDWSINDVELAFSVEALVGHFIQALNTLTETIAEFELLFASVAAQKAVLQGFAGKVTENNHLEKVEYLLTNRDAFQGAIQVILKGQSFIKTQFPKVKEFKRFIEAVTAELNKADRQDVTISQTQAEFERLYQQDLVNHYGALQQQAQIVKDSYFRLLKTGTVGMTQAYQVLNGKVDGAMRELQDYPAELNQQNRQKLEVLKRYCGDRQVEEPVLDFGITCKKSGYSLSDVLNYTALAPSKESELLIIQSSFKREPTPVIEPDPSGVVVKPPRQVKVQFPRGVMTVAGYRSWLQSELQKLTAASAQEAIELDLEGED